MSGEAPIGFEEPGLPRLRRDLRRIVANWVVAVVSILLHALLVLCALVASGVLTVTLNWIARYLGGEAPLDMLIVFWVGAAASLLIVLRFSVGQLRDER